MSKSLIKLAQEGTEDARRQLFAQVCELVVANLDQRTDRELAIFAEVILKLYSVGSPKDRSRLACKLAAQANTPNALARRIAEDEVRIAMPVLTNSPVLTQEDLLNLIEEVSDSHLQVIARRTDLSTQVTDVLVQKGKTPVHRILAGNREIRLSRDTMLQLVKYAAEDTVLREDLALRSDLSPTVCHALLPLVNDETKRRLRGIIAGSLTQDQLDQIARLKVLRHEFGDALENTDMSLVWQDAEQAQISVDEIMILLLQDGRFNHAIELLGARGRTAQKSIKDAVFSGKQELVFKTAAKAGLGTATFALFAKARSEHLKLPSTHGSEWANAYKKFLDETVSSKQGRSGDFQAKRREKKTRSPGLQAARPAASAP
ncbi:DUF2336 domain-containing protein [Roseibium sp.]|uniref:DUF2336 domain-containing protein n=1 Tax=Roseibium sp. TaxID=1936156 RepID=UPI003D10DFB1